MIREKIRDGFEHEIFIDVPDTVVKWQKSKHLYDALYVTSIGFFPNAKFHYCERPKGSQYPILIYCIKGKGYLEIENKRIQISEHQLILIPKDIPHTYFASLAEPWSIYWSQFDGEMSPLYINLIQNNIHAISIIDGQQQNLMNYFNEMIALLSSGFSKEHMLHCNNIHKTLFSLINHRSYNHTNQTCAYIDYTNQAITYMRAHLSKQITIDELATSVGISRSYFQHLFKEKTGLAPLEYVNTLKMQKACELITTTNLSIKSIALQVGFSDPYYFSRAFKKVMSSSPKMYRHNTIR